MKQVERGHWSNEAKEYYYAKRAAALGVQGRGGDRDYHPLHTHQKKVSLFDTYISKEIPYMFPRRY
jgi:hypothetical protein